MNMSGESILISVALPVYNGANYVREALDSVLAQEFPHFELVVSDNCSTDETPEILEAYAKSDNRIRVSRADTFLPQADNVNRVVELCSGTWVKLLCHDDRMYPECLRELHEAICSPCAKSVGLIGHGGDWLFANGYCYRPVVKKDVQPRFWKGPEFIGKLLNSTTDVGVPSLTTAMVRKEAWNASGRFDRRFVHFDVFLWIHLLMKRDYLFIPSLLTTTRIHGEQVAVSARKSLRSINDFRLFYREFLSEFGSELSLSALGRTKVSLRPLGAAGTTVAIEFLKGNVARAVSLFCKMPLLWWPLLPAFIVRNFRKEHRKIIPLRPYVPVHLIYP